MIIQELSHYHILHISRSYDSFLITETFCSDHQKCLESSDSESQMSESESQMSESETQMSESESQMSESESQMSESET